MPKRTKFLLMVGIVITSAFSLCSYLQGIPVLPQGPGKAVSEVAKSIVQHGTLTPRYFQEVHDQLREASKNVDGTIWQDIFALGSSGKLLPKHSILSAVAAVPFFFVFGDLGFWIMQQVVLLSLLYATYVMVNNISGRDLAWSTITCCLFLSPTLFHSNIFSYDLHGCALIICGLTLSQRCPWWGSVIMTLSIFVRPSYVILATLLLCARLSAPTLSQRCRLLLGWGSVLLSFFLYNSAMWGSPFLTSYARLLEFRRGEAVVMQFKGGPDMSVFLTNWSQKLVSESGLLPYNLCLIGLPCVLCWLCQMRVRTFQLWCLGSALAYTLYIFSYYQWMVSTYGNRFLLPAIYLYLLSLIPIIPDLVERVRGVIRGRNHQT